MTERDVRHENVDTIGLISDVHANYPALRAVLDEMPPVDALVCAGDVIGYNAMPVECLETVRDHCEYVVQGNHDRTVETPEAYSFNRMAYEGLKLARERLSAEQIAWLSSRPERLKLFDGRLLLVHSHPENRDEYVYEDDFPSVATYMASETSVLALGHTHEQGAVDMSRFDRHGYVVNPGSVGQPRDGDPRAAYAVVNLNAPTVDLHRVAYPTEEIVRANEQAGLPQRTSERLWQD